MKEFITLLLLFQATPSLAYREFGYRGQDGWTGQNGAYGISGPDIALFADGSFQDLNLDGTPGYDGKPGEDGKDAWGCSQPWNAEWDLQGARGGNGGNGGRGGDGGNGGNATIYYHDISLLKNIRLHSVGAHAGLGSKSGREGRGCSCSQYSWSVKKCRWVRDPLTGQQKEECSYENFRCSNGLNGTSGWAGGMGMYGALGQITLVKGSQKLQPGKLHESRTLDQISGFKFELTKNEFAEKKGALALLATGSFLDDTYREFVQRTTLTAEVVWAAPQNSSEFVNQTVVFRHTAQGIKAEWPQDLWMNVTEVKSGNHTVFTVQNVTPKADAKSVEFFIEKTEFDTQVRVSTKVMADADEFHVSIWQERTSLAGGRRLVFEGPMDKTLIQVADKEQILKIGALPVTDAKKVFKKGKTVFVKVRILRTFQADTVEVQSNEMQYTLPK